MVGFNMKKNSLACPGFNRLYGCLIHIAPVMKSTGVFNRRHISIFSYSFIGG